MDDGSRSKSSLSTTSGGTGGGGGGGVHRGTHEKLLQESTVDPAVLIGE